MPNDWGARATILVVDDDKTVCAALARQLGRAGYLPYCVRNGTTALEFARAGGADLVILDLLMPGLSGMDTCRELRLIPGWEAVPVLILTGYGDETLYPQALACGADDFLTKPVRTEELLLRVKSLIRIRGLLADLQAGVDAVREQNEVILKGRAMRERLEAFLLHDLKNPIAAILLLAEMKSETSGQDKASWELAQTHAQHLMDLTVSWMDHIGAEHGGLRPNLADVELGPFLDKVVGRLALWFRTREVEPLVERGGPGLSHPMDPALMDRVLGNLVDNSLRFAPQGSQLLLGAGRGAGNSLLLRVGDRGPGVPPEQRERLFDLFAQLESAGSQHRERHNRGLGLAFCKAAVEAHGGRIWVEDNPGGGSLFLVEIPARDRA
jgi:two-component system, sensor histidine kinase and response regulator